ncbi:hypothetical protein [Streptomyces venezuelae]
MPGVLEWAGVQMLGLILRTGSALGLPEQVDIRLKRLPTFLAATLNHQPLDA